MELSPCTKGGLVIGESGSMYDRLQRTFGFFSPGSKSQSLVQNGQLLNTYWQSLNDYLCAFQINQATPFHFPFDCFYLENETLYSSASYYYHGHLTKKRALKYGLSDYLTSCGLPGYNSPTMNALIKSLVELLKLYHFSRAESALRKLQHFSTELSAFLRLVPMNMVSGCLVYQPHRDYHEFGKPYLYCPVTSLHIPPHIPRQTLRQFFSARISELSDHTFSFPAPSLVFYDFHDFWNFFYQPDADKCAAEPVVPSPLCSVKAIQWQQPPALVPPDVQSLLSTFVGYDLAALKNMAALFARILAPAEFGATVLYTHTNAAVLRNFFAKVFQPWLISFSSQSGGSPRESISINKLTKSSSIRALFEARAAGKGLVLLQDIPPSSDSKQILSKLRKGTPIPIKHPFVPKQYLHCNAHLLCITNDRTRAQELRTQLKAHWIDLSAVESPVSDTPTISDDALNWLRCIFPLLGLQLLSTDASAYVPPLSSPAPFDAVEEFMSGGVIQVPGAFCTSFELYHAYREYYKARFSVDPPLNKIVFVKRARAYVTSHAKQHINYRHTRLGKEKRLRWYFTGLEPSPWVKIAPSAPSEGQRSAFHEYLNSGYALMPKSPFSNRPLRLKGRVDSF